MPAKKFDRTGLKDRNLKRESEVRDHDRQQNFFDCLYKVAGYSFIGVVVVIFLAWIYVMYDYAMMGRTDDIKNLIWNVVSALFGGVIGKLFNGQKLIPK